MKNRIIIRTEDGRGRLSKEVYGFTEARRLIEKLNNLPDNDDVFFDIQEESDDQNIDDFYLHSADVLKANALTYDSEVGEHLNI